MEGDQGAQDAVVSYVVGANGPDKTGYEELRQRLAEGLRIVDVHSTEIRPGGQSNFAGAVSVTVVLTKAKSPMYARRMAE